MLSHYKSMNTRTEKKNPTDYLIQSLKRMKKLNRRGQLVRTHNFSNNEHKISQLQS